MNAFDSVIIVFFNQFATRSWTFDHLLAFLSTHNFLKAGMVVSMLWWIWFRRDPGGWKRRQYVIGAILLTLVALLLARVLALTLPFRGRPLEDPSFVVPYGMEADVVSGWSAFPSDHAVMFFALSISLFYASRRIGWIALLYSSFVICLPRIYLGYHHPTDIVCGGVLGASIGSLVRSERIRGWLACVPISWARNYPGPFYVCYFAITYEMANMFDDVREVFAFAVRMLSAHL